MIIVGETIAKKKTSLIPHPERGRVCECDLLLSSRCVRRHSNTRCRRHLNQVGLLVPRNIRTGYKYDRKSDGKTNVFNFDIYIYIFCVRAVLVNMPHKNNNDQRVPYMLYTCPTDCVNNSSSAVSQFIIVN